jgi:hypothetical protein
VTTPRKPWTPPCRHPKGGALPCGYCGRKTCADCHHGTKHLEACTETRERETRQR